MGSLSLLQGIFPTQGSNPGLRRYRRILCQLSHKGSPHILSPHKIQSSLKTSCFFKIQLTGMHVCVLSLVQHFGLQGLLPHQAPLSMEFSRQEYWSGCHFLLQGVFSSQGSNLLCLHFPHWQVDSLPTVPPGMSQVTGIVIIK